MSDTIEISETFKRVVTQDRKFPFKDYSDKESSSWLIASAHFLENCFPDSVLVLCKIKHPEIAYVSRNCESIIGHTASDFKRTSPQEYFNLVHPDDRSGVLRLYKRMEQYTKMKAYRPENWKFAFHYRLRLKNEKYVHLRDEKAAFLHSSGERVHYSILNILDDVSALNVPFMTLSKKFNHSFRKIDTYIPQTSTEILTRRELEVLKCLDAGLSTKEIASRLSISPHTIRNHKTSLFKKAKAKTGLQVIRNARRLQWI